MACPTFRRVIATIPILLIALLLVTPAQAGAGDDAQAAQKSALAWLKLVDEGDYKASWHESGAFFQDAMAAEKWSELMNGVRKPLGKALSRKLVSAQARQTIPGAPDGKYYLLLFKTSFSNKKTAEERVTLIHEPKRGWRVAGYFIK